MAFILRMRVQYVTLAQNQTSNGHTQVHLPGLPLLTDWTDSTEMRCWHEVVRRVTVQAAGVQSSLWATLATGFSGASFDEAIEEARLDIEDSLSAIKWVALDDEDYDLLMRRAARTALALLLLPPYTMAVVNLTLALVNKTTVRCREVRKIINESVNEVLAHASVDECRELHDRQRQLLSHLAKRMWAPLYAAEDRESGRPIVAGRVLERRHSNDARIVMDKCQAVTSAIAETEADEEEPYQTLPPQTNAQSQREELCQPKPLLSGAAFI